MLAGTRPIFASPWALATSSRLLESSTRTGEGMNGSTCGVVADDSAPISTSTASRPTAVTHPTVASPAVDSGSSRHFGGQSGGIITLAATSGSI